jgi:hypothetical protein
VRRAFLVLIAVLISTQIVVAQENTPFIPPTFTWTPTPTSTATTELTPTARLSPTISATPNPEMAAFIASAPMEILFPSGAIFSVAMVRHANELGVARLEIDIEGMDAPIVYEDVASAFVSPDDPFKLIVPLEQVMPMFGEIHYRWTIDGGYETGQAEATVRYVDPQEMEWVTNIAGNGGVSLYSAGRGYPAISSALGQAYDLLTFYIGEMNPLRFALYRQGLAPACQQATNDEGDVEYFVMSSEFEITFACNQSLVDRAIVLGNVQIIADSDMTPPEVLERDLFDRLLASAFSWYGTGNVPAWFEVGLRNYLAPEPLRGALFDAQTAVRANAAFSTADLGAVPSVAMEENRRELWQAQSYGMILYIVSQVGIDGLFELTRALETQPFDQAYQEVVGQPAELLVQSWARWLFSEGASFLYSITPYLPPTPTPTSTYTPSNTPTASSTGTSTFTPTVTPVERSATPAPTLTPSRTPQPPPPTPTPRSMSDLVTLTPVPTTPSQNVGFLANEQSRIILIGMLVIVLGLLGVAYVVASRRR